MPPLNMVERKEPTFVTFADGERVSGVLLSIEKIEVEKRPAVRYTVQDVESGELSSFLGTHMINTKLRRTDIGHVIDVRYEGLDLNVVRNGNAMRIFKVFVSDRPLNSGDPGVAHDGTLITNDDIGF